jgi:hypothetical protein
MKTMFDMDDDLMRRAKLQAAADGSQPGQQFR